jgi:hypothetical protein
MKTALIRILTLATLATSGGGPGAMPHQAEAAWCTNRLNSLFPRSRLIFLQHETPTDLPVLTWPPVAD